MASISGRQIASFFLFPPVQFPDDGSEAVWLINWINYNAASCRTRFTAEASLKWSVHARLLALLLNMSYPVFPAPTGWDDGDRALGACSRVLSIPVTGPGMVGECARHYEVNEKLPTGIGHARCLLSAGQNPASSAGALDGGDTWPGEIKRTLDRLFLRYWSNQKLDN